MAVRNILLVDDDVEDREIFVSAMGEVAANVHCDTATDGFDALRLLQEDGFVMPELIFLDLNMPRMDGRQFLETRNKIDRLKPIPVIIYSTTKRLKDIEETQQLGAIDFLTKPVQYTEICKALTRLLKNLDVTV
jgi:CheY-like chemotaxis protein